MFDDILGIKKRMGWISITTRLIDDITSGRAAGLYDDALDGANPIRHIVDDSLDCWHILFEWYMFDKCDSQNDDFEYPYYQLTFRKDKKGNIVLDTCERCQGSFKENVPI